MDNGLAGLFGLTGLRRCVNRLAFLFDKPAVVNCKNRELRRIVKTFSRHTLRKRFRTSCKVLDAARLEALTIHHGRHTFISHALAGGRSLAEVRDAAGHANVSITSGYIHVAVQD
jgi:integrase